METMRWLWRISQLKSVVRIKSIESTPLWTVALVKIPVACTGTFLADPATTEKKALLAKMSRTL